MDVEHLPRELHQLGDEVTELRVQLKLQHALAALHVEGGEPPRTVTSFSMAYSFSSYAVSRAMVLKSVLQPLPFTLNCTEL